MEKDYKTYQINSVEIKIPFKFILGGAFCIPVIDLFLFKLSPVLSLPGVWLIIITDVLFFVLFVRLIISAVAGKIQKKKLSSDEQYKNLYEGNPNPLWFYDPENFRFVSVNDAAVAHYGYSRSEFLSMTIFDIRPTKDAESVRTSYSKMSDGNLSQSGTWEHFKKDGSVIYANISSHKAWLDGKEVVMVMAIDTTQKFIHEQELQSLNTELIEQSNRLDKNYSRLEETLNSISDSFFTLNQNWEITKTNSKFYTNANISDSAEGRLLTDVFPNTKDTIFYKEAKKAMRNRQDVKFEEYYPDLKKWFCISVYPIEEGLAVYFTDITNDKEKDIQLKLALERYEMVAEATGDVIYDLDLSADVLIFSTQISTLTGFSFKDIEEGLNWWRNLVHPEDLNKLIESQEKVINNFEKNWQAEYRVLTANNVYKYVYDQGHVLFDENQKPSRIIGAIKDIDALIQTAEQIKRLGEILNKINTPVIISNSKGMITWVNPAFLQKTGFNENEILGKGLVELLALYHINKEQIDLIWNAVLLSQNFSIEFINYCNSEKGFWESFSLSPVYNKLGEVESFISVESDITERKEKEAEIALQKDKLTAVSWINSHQVRKPVSSILGLIQLLKETNQVEEQKEILNMLYQCTTDLDQVIHEINKKASKEKKDN